jgi:hypothetical protein
MNSLHPIVLLVKDNQDSLSQVFFEAFSKSRDKTEAISKILKILQLNSSASADLVEQFETFWKIHGKTGTVHDFFSVVSGWIIENGMQSIPSIIVQTSFLAYLKKLSKYYNKVLPDLNFKDSSLIRTSFRELKIFYQHFLKIYPRLKPKLVFRSQVLEKEMEGLLMIFKFYAVQHLFLGKHPTFKKVSEEKEVWDLGIFLIFSKHFFSSNELKTGKKKNKEFLVEVFKKIAGKNMSFQMFLKALDEVAKKTVEVNKPEFLESVEEKDFRIFLYERMKVADFGFLRNKLKPFHRVFGGEGHFRKASEGFVDHGLRKNGRSRNGKEGRLTFRSNIVSRNSSVGNLERLAVPKSAFDGKAVTTRVRVYSEKCFKALRDKVKKQQ